MINVPSTVSIPDHYFTKPADIIIEKRKGRARVLNRYGDLLHETDNDTYAFKVAMQRLPSNGLAKLYIIGDFVIREKITLRSNLIIENDGRITGDLLDPVLYGDDLENVFIIGRGWIRQSKVNIYGQANGNFNTTYQCIKIENSKNIVIDHEVGGFPTTSETDARPKGPSWAVHIKNCEKVWLRIRASYSLEHVLVEDSKHVMIEAVVEKSYDSSIWLLRSDNIDVRAVIDLTNVPCCANGLEINTCRNVNADVVVYNPPVHGVWLYFDPNAGMDMFNINVRAEVYGGSGNGVRGVENGDPTKVYNISIDARIYNVGGKGILMEKASNVDIDAIVKNAGSDSLFYYKLQNARIKLISISPSRADMYDYARDTGEGAGLSSLRIIDFYSDKYQFNVYPQDIEYPYRYTLFLKDYSLAAGAVVSLLPLNARTNKFLGKIGVVYNSNSSIYVQLYNADAGVVQNEDNTTGKKDWAIWWAYNYQVRLRNSDTVNSQTGDIMIEIQSIKPLW